MAKNQKLDRSKYGKVLGVPLNPEQTKRFQDLRPSHVYTDAAFGRQLILEGLDRLEADRKKKGRAASV